MPATSTENNASCSFERRSLSGDVSKKARRPSSLGYLLEINDNDLMFNENSNLAVGEFSEEFDDIFGKDATVNNDCDAPLNVFGYDSIVNIEAPLEMPHTAGSFYSVETSIEQDGGRTFTTLVPVHDIPAQVPGAGFPTDSDSFAHYRSTSGTTHEPLNFQNSWGSGLIESPSSDCSFQPLDDPCHVPMGSQFMSLCDGLAGIFCNSVQPVVFENLETSSNCSMFQNVQTKPPASIPGCSGNEVGSVRSKRPRKALISERSVRWPLPLSPCSANKPEPSQHQKNRWKAAISSMEKISLCEIPGVKWQLWQFLLQLLLHPQENELYIHWTDNPWEFKIKDPFTVARLWGEYKGYPKMNYIKLARSIRNYYRKPLENGIIEKKTAEKFVYEFGDFAKVQQLSGIDYSINPSYDLLQHRNEF